MKAQRGNGGIALSLTSALWGCVVNASPQPLYPRGRHTLYRRLVMDGCWKSRLHRDWVPEQPL